MARGIKIRPNSVRTVNSRLPGIKNKINGVKYSVVNIKNAMQYEVKARNNIDSSLNGIIYDLASLENSVGELYRTVNDCVNIYVSADDKVKNLTHNVNDWK